MTTCDILYTADEASLPANLPTLEEIEAATEILSDRTQCKVVGIGVHFVVKYGAQVDKLEGETTLFLGQSTCVPVPRVYALFQTPYRDIKRTYIIMERIRGPTLASEWPKMNRASKVAVSAKLRIIFEDMRKLESPGGYCSLSHQGLPDGLFWTMDPSKPFTGPFDTEEELNNAMVAKQLQDGCSKHQANYFARTYKEFFINHAPVFSHGDFQRKNIMIRNSPMVEGKEAQWDVTHPDIVIIDWEYAGWYPSYWDYARAIYACGRWEDDWNEWVEQFLEPFRNEYAWMELLLRILWT
ncbi:hypothetical protein P153DRAFT_367983 [Dothidotthia symphoricarpi CBS 119687]|uniref:Aminoglycoside phosphotransferase domain-containing protein n=1 Tax=Dothidotthia symphoricarpi CBS 119687 TaxID=1392245 RepID=A0A6A6AA53_9PLEO|nr:uncharacterized protein P153DRAFT_367983 [Dothidotthia symphoricarpi CBS 119687]KAF2128093.1 hypothetical protein P153DRAFT_367983 [Dothidotthia symphoricarpi CBS 119687]